MIGIRIRGEGQEEGVLLVLELHGRTVLHRLEEPLAADHSAFVHVLRAGVLRIGAGPLETRDAVIDLGVDTAVADARELRRVPRQLVVDLGR